MRTGNTAQHETPRGKLRCRSSIIDDQYSQAVRHRNPYWPFQTRPCQPVPPLMTGTRCCRSIASVRHRKKLVPDIIQERRAMTTCGNRRSMRQSDDNRNRGGAQVGLRGLELRQFRWVKGIRSPFRVVLSPKTLPASRQISQRRAKIFFTPPRPSRSGSVLADAAEVDPE